jgi:hypothetical protein
MSHKSTLFVIYLLVFYSCENAQCQWYPETCDVDGGMYSISMLNNTSGWIGGSGGICKYDGNGHWDLINTLNVSSLKFTDSLNGWAAVGSIGIFKTSDGGYNWQTYYDTISSGNFYRINDFYFIDTSRGWKIGGFPGHKNAFISSTIDGGKNWSIQYQGNATDWYDGIYFPDSLYGYVAGYRGDGDSVLILKTKDGGLTWEEQIYLAINAGLSRNIFFTDSITGWIVGGWQEGQLILHTENSGIGTGEISDQSKIFNGDLTLKTYPNPCTNQTELSIGTDSERTLTLNLFSFNGEKTTIFNGINFSAGKHPYILNTEMISSGIYLLTIFGEGISANSKLVVLK